MLTPVRTWLSFRKNWASCSRWATRDSSPPLGETLSSSLPAIERHHAVRPVHVDFVDRFSRDRRSLGTTHAFSFLAFLQAARTPEAALASRPQELQFQLEVPMVRRAAFCIGPACSLSSTPGCDRQLDARLQPAGFLSIEGSRQPPAHTQLLLGPYFFVDAHLPPPRPPRFYSAPTSPPPPPSG